MGAVADNPDFWTTMLTRRKGGGFGPHWYPKGDHGPHGPAKTEKNIGCLEKNGGLAILFEAPLFFIQAPKAGD